VRACHAELAATSATIPVQHRTKDLRRSSRAHVQGLNTMGNRNYHPGRTVRLRENRLELSISWALSFFYEREVQRISAIVALAENALALAELALAVMYAVLTAACRTIPKVFHVLISTSS